MLGFLKRDNGKSSKDGRVYLLADIDYKGNVSYKRAVLYDERFLDKDARCFDVHKNKWFFGDVLVAEVESDGFWFDYLKKLVKSGEYVIMGNVEVIVNDVKVQGPVTWDGKNLKVGKFVLGKPDRVVEVSLGFMGSVFNDILDGEYRVWNMHIIDNEFYILRLKKYGDYPPTFTRGYAVANDDGVIILVGNKVFGNTALLDRLKMWISEFNFWRGG